MKITTRQTFGALLVMLLGISLAQSSDNSMHNSGNDYQLESAVLASGGNTTAGGEYELNGTLGQPVAEQSSGDDYTLHSGFWPTVKTDDDVIFRNGFE